MTATATKAVAATTSGPAPPGTPLQYDLWFG
jgi:hypothetical protein